MSDKRFTSGDVLACDCGETVFITGVQYITHSQHGSVEKPLGKVCIGCKQPLDKREMMEELELSKRQQELQELQERVESRQKNRKQRAATVSNPS